MGKITYNYTEDNYVEFYLKMNILSKIFLLIVCNAIK